MNCVNRERKTERERVMEREREQNRMKLIERYGGV
jgi:hypothetical protein